MQSGITIEFVHSEIKRLEHAIKVRGLQSDVHFHMNWIGDYAELSLKAMEPYDKNAYWRREKRFTCDANIGVASLFVAADKWVAELPNDVHRSVELAIEVLNKTIEQLPEHEANEVAKSVWDGIRRGLQREIDALGKNLLPSPNAIRDLPRDTGAAGDEG